MSFENDSAVVTELVTYTENDGDLHRQVVQPILTKKAQGKYDSDKAVTAFMYLAEAGSRKYAKEFSGNEKEWHDNFPINIRRAAATHWRDEFEAEFDLGNYDHLLPKKYQDKSAPGASAQEKTHAYEVGEDVWWWGRTGKRIVGRVVRILFGTERPDYQVETRGSGTIVLKSEFELSSETGRQKLVQKTKSSDRRKRRTR